MMRALMRMGVAVLLLGSWAAGQIGSPERSAMPTILKGVVRDAATNQPIPYVVVTLDNEERGYVQQQSTDRQGKFEFAGIGRAVFLVKVRQPGYLDTQRRVDLTLSTTAYESFSLRPDPKASPGVVIPPEGPGATISAIPPAAQQEFDKAKKLLEENKVGDAIDHLKKAVAAHPSFLDAHLALGTAYLDQAKLPEATTHLKRALEINEQVPGAHLALGAVYNRSKDFGSAEKSLLRGLELAPDSPEGNLEMARACMALQKWPEAETHASKAARLKPEEPVVHVMLGNLMLKKRDNRTALVEFKEYLRLAPNGPMAPAARDVVAKLEKALGQAQP